MSISISLTSLPLLAVPIVVPLFDGVEHTLFECPEWESLRAEMAAVLGCRPGPDDVEDLLCGRNRQDLLASRRRRVLLDMIEEVMGRRKRRSASEELYGGGNYGRWKTCSTQLCCR